MIIWKYNEDIDLIDKIIDNINHIKGYYAYKDGNNNIHVSHLRNKDIRFTLEYSFGSFSGIVIGSPYFFHQEKYKKDNLKIISYFQFLNETRNKSLIIKNNNYNKALGRIKLLKQEYGIIPLDSFYLEDNLEEIPNQKIISISNEIEELKDKLIHK